ncbi:hypothetical protein RB195_024950 [Necator americanus]|uniref:Uncharacterized protein n=1 Tax=Necator americanus TaxID=51031 RepID=A0ABR1EQ91_NECAM
MPWETAIKKEALVEVVESGPYQTCAEMAERLECDELPVRKRSQLGYRRRHKKDQEVPHLLTPANKMARFNIW